MRNKPKNNSNNSSYYKIDDDTYRCDTVVIVSGDRKYNFLLKGDVNPLCRMWFDSVSVFDPNHNGTERAIVRDGGYQNIIDKNGNLLYDWFFQDMFVLLPQFAKVYAKGKCLANAYDICNLRLISDVWFKDISYKKELGLFEVETGDYVRKYMDFNGNIFDRKKLKYIKDVNKKEIHIGNVNIFIIQDKK